MNLLVDVEGKAVFPLFFWIRVRFLGWDWGWVYYDCGTSGFTSRRMEGRRTIYWKDPSLSKPMG